MKIEFGTLLRVCGTEITIGGDGKRLLSAPEWMGWDKVTRYGRIAYESLTEFSITLYSDWEREDEEDTETVLYGDLPGPVTVGDLTVQCGSFLPLDEGEEIDFTVFGGNAPEIGLHDGCLAWVTGSGYHEGLTAAPKNPNTDEPVTVWKGGMITGDGLGTPTMEVEFSNGGSYGVMTGGEIRVPNSVPVRDEEGAPFQTLTAFLAARSLSLVNAKVWTGTFIDQAWHPWSLTVAENPEVDETEMVIPLQDPHPFIHRQVPQQTLTRQTYRTLPSGQEGKAMPLVIGNTVAKLIQIAGAGSAQHLARINNRNIEMVFAYNWIRNGNPPFELELVTPGISFGFNDARLIGALEGGKRVPKYLAVALPGITGTKSNRNYYSAKIISNLPTSGGIFTSVFLANPFVRDNATAGGAPVEVDPILSVIDGVTPGGVQGKETWLFRILEVSDFRVVSEHGVHAYPDGLASLLKWDENEFVKIFARALVYYPQGGYNAIPTPAGALLWPTEASIRATPVLGAETLALLPPVVHRNRFEGSSLLNVWGSASGLATNDFPAVAPALVDRNIATYYQANLNFSYGTAGGARRGITFLALLDNGDPLLLAPTVNLDSWAAWIFDLDLPDDFTMEDGDKLFVGINFSGRFAALPIASTQGVAFTFGAGLVNPSGQEIAKGVSARVLGSGDNIAAGVDYSHSLMGMEYFNEVGGGWDPIEPLNPTNTAEADIYRFLQQPGFAKGCKIRIKLFLYLWQLFNAGTAAGPFHSFFRLHELALFVRRRDNTDDVFTRVTGVRFGADWGEGRDPPRPEGDPVLSVGDAMEYLIRKQDEKPEYVNPAGFDNFRLLRQLPTWFCGHQMLEARDTFDWLQDLAKASFSVLFPDHEGRRLPQVIERYDDNGPHPEPLQEFTDANVVADSMGPAQVAPLDRLYTSLKISYDPNPETGDYRVISVTNEDQETFPAINANVPGSSPPIPLWTIWVSGLDAYNAQKNVVYSGAAYNQNYAAAKALWEKARAAYLMVGQKNRYELKADWLKRAVDWRDGIVSSTEDAAWLLAEFVADYLFRLWRLQEFSVSLTPETTSLLPMHRIGYGDPVRTDGNKLYALVKRLALDTKSMTLRVTAAHRADDAPYGKTEDPPAEYYRIEDMLPGEGIEEYQDTQDVELVWKDEQGG